MEIKETKSLLKDLDEIISSHKQSVSKKRDFSFNTFNASTYGKHLENFHSDIISEILNPKGKHTEKELPLFEFLSYLNKEHDAKINPSDFKNSTTYRELGRIDIALLDDNSQKAILIENKINSAPDMDDQLTRYYNWCLSKKYEVTCIIYLTLSGEKTAPQVIAEKAIEPINISAFSNTKSDLVNGWLKPLISKSSFDLQSFLNQYQRLLIQLAYDNMETNYYNSFYDLADDMSVLQKIEYLNSMACGIPKFRMDKFVNDLNDFSPFTKSYRYKPYHMLYERFIEHDNSFKIDVWFDDNGDSWVHFWNPIKSGKEAFESCKNKIEQIGFQNQMVECSKEEDWIGYSKGFLFSDHKSLRQIDEEILEFTQELMKKLKPL
jgi:hypothetical protein